MAKRACLSPVNGAGLGQNRSGWPRRTESTIRSDRHAGSWAQVDVPVGRSYAARREARRTGETEPGDASSVTVTEFMFLALGLVLGVPSGVALVEVLRARPPARHEVRLTVSQDAIPRRRATTLADDAFVTSGPEPARGGPADRRELTGAAPLGEPDRRTSVLVDGLPDPMADAGRIAASGQPIGVAISGGRDPMLGALQAAGRAAAVDGAPGRAVIADQAAAAAPSATRIPGLTAIGLLDPTPGAAGSAMPANASIDAGGGLDP